MMPILQVGSLSLPTPSIIMVVGVWLGITLSEHLANQYGINKNQLGSLMLLALIAGLIGARLAYVIRYPSAFSSNPLDIFSRNPGLLDFSGGILVACISTVIFIQRKNLSLLSTLDSLTPAFAVIAVALGFSHLASGEVFGIPTNLPWAITLLGEDRHPTQVYEILSATIILLIILKRNFLIKSDSPGTVFLLFVALTSLAHIIIATFRADVALTFGGIRINQLYFWLFFAFALWGIGKLKYTDLKTN